MKLFISSSFRVAADLTKDSKLVTDWVTALGTSGEEAETWTGRHEAMRPMRVRISASKSCIRIASEGS